MLKIDGNTFPQGGGQHKGTATVSHITELAQSDTPTPDAMVAQADNIQAQENNKKNPIPVFRLPENVSGMKSIALILSGIGIASVLSWFGNFRQPETPLVAQPQQAAPQIIYITPPATVNATGTPVYAASQEVAPNAAVVVAASAANRAVNGNLAIAASNPTTHTPNVENGAADGEQAHANATNNVAKKVAAPQQRNLQPNATQGAQNQNIQATARNTTQATPAATKSATPNVGANTNIPVTKHSPNLKSIGMIDPRADALRLKQQAAQPNNRAAYPVNGASAFAAPQQGSNGSMGGMMMNNAYANRATQAPVSQTQPLRQSSGGEEISFNKAYLEKRKERNTETAKKDTEHKQQANVEHTPNLTLNEQNNNEESAPIVKCSPFKTKSECR